MIIFHNFIYAISLFIMISIGVYAWMYKDKPGARALIFLMFLSFFWNITSFFELIASTLEMKLFWRNIQQISSFLIPFTIFVFIQSFLDNKRMLNASKYLIIIPIIFLGLILTNPFHGLVRSGYELIVVNDNFVFLDVKLTALGSINVYINLSLIFFGVVSLFSHYRKALDQLENQIRLFIVGLILISFLLVFNMIVLRGLSVYIMTSIFYMPGIFLMFYALFKYDFFNTSPLSKDKLLEAINQIIVVINSSGDIIEYNYRAQSFFKEVNDVTIEKGMSFYEGCHIPLKLHINDLKSRKDLQRIKIHIKETPEYFAIYYHPLYADKKYLGMMIIMENITITHNYEKKLKERADRDSLTDLYNRSTFEKAYNKISHHHKGMIMGDIDDFKHINDTYGHAVGDIVLKQISQLLKTTFKSKCLLGRLGGEEFAIGCYDLSEATLYEFGETFRQEVENTPIKVNGSSINITVSVGISYDRTGQKLFDEIRHESDNALYQAKDANKNCVMQFKH